MSGLFSRPSGNPARARIFRPLLCALTGTALALTSITSAQEECELGIVGQLDVPGCNLGGNYSTWTQGRVASHGDFLYGGKNMQYCGAEMVVLEASDPANPTQVGSFKVPGGRNETDPDGLSNIFEILADPDRMVVYISTSYPWATRANRIYAVDVSDPSNPTEIGRLLCGFTGYGMTLRGDHLFLARGNGLDIINVSDPANMTIVGSVAGGGSPRRMTDVAVYGNYAYMSGQTNGYSQGIEVYDISNLASPQKIPTTIALSYIVYGEYAGNSGRIPTYLQIAGDALYFMQGNNNNQPRQLHVLDLANPAAPTVESTVPAGSYPTVILVKDETLYTVGDGFLKRFSISDPLNPDLVDTTPSSSLISLSVSSTRAFGAHARNGFLFFGPCFVVPPDSPPIANAGVDFSVNEGQLAVALDGSGSSDPDNDPLTYAWVQVGGTTVALTGATTVSPTFTAPVVPLGGETLSFDLTVTANGETSTDNVSVTVVNVNHPPVADAGMDQTLANANAVAEGSPVTLQGEDSFDIDNDVIDFAWTQVSGPAVTLTGANTANPTFDAPYFEAGGAAGVVATLTFELLVDDGFPADAPAEGYTLDNVRDTVTIEITNTNNLPVASAGADQTVHENTAVALNGSLSSDPDADALTYAWTQIGGTPVVLSAGDTATLSFTAPFVSAGGADLEFQLSVDDGYGGSSTDNVVIHVQNANDPPLAGAAQPTIGLLWPPNHGLVAVGITGVSDPDNNATIVITSVTQDEPTNGQGDGDTAIDAIIDGESVLVRAERSGKGDGRVYHIHFTASDLEGSASGVVKVTVPQSKKKAAVDGGELFNSTE